MPHRWLLAWDRPQGRPMAELVPFVRGCMTKQDPRPVALVTSLIGADG